LNPLNILSRPRKFHKQFIKRRANYDYREFGDLSAVNTYSQYGNTFVGIGRALRFWISILLIAPELRLTFGMFLQINPYFEPFATLWIFTGPIKLWETFFTREFWDGDGDTAPELTWLS